MRGRAGRRRSQAHRNIRGGPPVVTDPPVASVGTSAGGRRRAPRPGVLHTAERQRRRRRSAAKRTTPRRRSRPSPSLPGRGGPTSRKSSTPETTLAFYAFSGAVQLVAMGIGALKFQPSPPRTSADAWPFELRAAGSDGRTRHGGTGLVVPAEKPKPGHSVWAAPRGAAPPRERETRVHRLGYRRSHHRHHRCRPAAAPPLTQAPHLYAISSDVRRQRMAELGYLRWIGAPQVRPDPVPVNDRRLDHLGRLHLQSHPAQELHQVPHRIRQPEDLPVHPDPSAPGRGRRRDDHTKPRHELMINQTSGHRISPAVLGGGRDALPWSGCKACRRASAVSASSSPARDSTRMPAVVVWAIDSRANRPALSRMSATCPSPTLRYPTGHLPS